MSRSLAITFRCKQATLGERIQQYVVNLGKRELRYQAEAGGLVHSAKPSQLALRPAVNAEAAQNIALNARIPLAIGGGLGLLGGAGGALALQALFSKKDSKKDSRKDRKHDRAKQASVVEAALLPYVATAVRNGITEIETKPEDPLSFNQGSGAHTTSLTDKLKDTVDTFAKQEPITDTLKKLRSLLPGTKPVKAAPAPKVDADRSLTIPLALGGLGVVGGIGGAMALHSLFKKKETDKEEESEKQAAEAAADTAKVPLSDLLKGWWNGNPNTPGSAHSWVTGLWAAPAAQLAHRYGMFNPYVKTSGDPGILAGLMERAKALGVNVAHIPGAPDAFDANNARIQLSTPLERSSAGVLAHELGHAKFMGKQVGPWRQLGYSLGPTAASAGSLGVLFSKKQETGRNSALLGTLGTTPMLAEEIAASLHGFNMLRAAGSSRGKALGAFIGLPSYLAVASAPSTLHLMKSRMNGYSGGAAGPTAGVHLG